MPILDANGRPYAVDSGGSGYEGASQAPRMRSFTVSNIGPNASVGNSLATLRGRSRRVIKNDSLAKGGQEATTANMVGKGITPRFNFKGNPQLKEQVQELWLDSVSELDFDENTNFYGQQAIASNALFSDGECLALFRPRNRYADLAVPMQIQLLEADHLDAAYTTTLPNGNKIRMGIEYNSMGKRVAYWLYKDHPGEMYMNHDGWRRVRVPAKNICHVFDVTRPGQQRGLPSLSSVLVKLHEIDQCVDAELVRRKTTAMFGGFIRQIQEYSPENPNLMGQNKSINGQSFVALEPGTFPVLNPNEDVIFSQPHDVSGSYIAWMKQQLMSVARGMGITYDQLTGDLSEVNYSSIRAGLLEFRRALTMRMNKTLIYQFCRPIIQRWLDTAVLTGKLIIPDYAQNRRRYYRGITWQQDPWQWIDPYKDMLAEILEIRSGLRNYTQALAARGQDIESFFAERGEENIMIDFYKFVFDTDARKTNKTGIYQNTANEEEGNA